MEGIGKKKSSRHKEEANASCQTLAKWVHKDTGKMTFTCPQCETTTNCYSGYAYHMMNSHGTKKGVPPLELEENQQHKEAVHSRLENERNESGG